MAHLINIFDWQAWACPRREWEFADRYQSRMMRISHKSFLKTSHWVVFEPCHSFLLANKYGFPVHGWLSLYITSNKSFEEFSSPTQTSQTGQLTWSIMVKSHGVPWFSKKNHHFLVDEIPFFPIHLLGLAAIGTFTSFCVSRNVEARECRDCSCVDG